MIFLLAVFLIGLFAISTASAADNLTDDVASFGDFEANGQDIAASNNVSGEAIFQASDSNISEDECADVLCADCNDSVMSQDFNETVLAKTYADVYMKSITTRYNSGKYFDLGWSGYFDGYFKVYKGGHLYHSEYLSGYDEDREWSLNKMSPGTYSAKMITYNGITLGTAKIVIKKSSSRISVKSFRATAGSAFYCYAYVKDRYNGGGYDGGSVYFKINGRIYKANLKNGVAVAKIRIPNKIKTFTCRATFRGGQNVFGSSTTFKMIVKKKAQSRYKIITTTAKSYWIKKRSGSYVVATKIWDMTAGFMAPYKYIDTTLYKNGRQVINTKYYVNYCVNGKWTGWVQYGTTSTAHHRHAVADGARVGLIKVRFVRV